MRTIVCSSDGNTDSFDIEAGDFYDETFASFLFLICQGYVLKTLIDLMKENSFTLKKKKGKKKTISYKNYFWCKLCKWSSASCKYTCSSLIYAT